MRPKADRLRERARAHLLHSAENTRQTAEQGAGAIGNAGQVIADALKRGGKLMLCGNGGSAADCQHMAAELTGQMRKEPRRPGFAAIALTTDSSFLTAYSNDFGFESIFERQVQSLGRPGDVLIGISTSGNSANVIRAFDAARSLGITTVALTGRVGRLSKIADLAIAVPSSDTQHIQEAHVAILHALCDVIECCVSGHDPAGEGLQ